MRYLALHLGFITALGVTGLSVWFGLPYAAMGGVLAGLLAWIAFSDALNGYVDEDLQ